MNSNSLLFRQVNPDWVQDDRVTSQAFTPTPKDERRLSAYDGDQITAEASWLHFTRTLRYASVGVMAVTVDECRANGTTPTPDRSKFQEHVLIDFRALSRSKAKSVGKVLARVRDGKRLAISAGHPRRSDDIMSPHFLLRQQAVLPPVKPVQCNGYPLCRNLRAPRHLPDFAALGTAIPIVNRQGLLARRRQGH